MDILNALGLGGVVSSAENSVQTAAQNAWQQVAPYVYIFAGVIIVTCLGWWALIGVPLLKKR